MDIPTKALKKNQGKQSVSIVHPHQYDEVIAPS